MMLEVLNHRVTKGGYAFLEVKAGAVFKSAVPGQFLHIRVEQAYEPLLRRPLSLHDVIVNQKTRQVKLVLLYKIVGKGTRRLSLKTRGSKIDCLGPLGRGFDITGIKKEVRACLVAGGMGVAPLFFLARHLTANAGRQKPLVLIGARTKTEIFCEKEFKSLGCEVRVATDDGSKGYKGLVTDLLCEKLKDPDGLNSFLCACGPRPMLACISGIAREHNLRAQVSLEEFMGCGLGVCLSCAVQTTSGYQKVCHDGPVFDVRDIMWESSPGTHT